MRSDRLKQVREQRGISQRDLAARCGMGEKQIWRYENGESEPSADHLTKLALELEVTADYLLGLVDSPGDHLAESELSPMERKLISAVRRGMIVEALEAMTTLSKRGDETIIPGRKPAVNG